MSRRTLLSVLVVLSALVALCATAPVAGAQDTAAQKDQLDKRKRDLDSKIAEQDAIINQSDQLIAQRQAEVDRANVQTELLADEYARVVDNRREPARTRVLIAIDAYVRGDPRITSLLADIVRMETRSEELTQRTLYSAVVEDADQRLANIDSQLRDFGTRAQNQQNATRSARDALNAVQAKRNAAADTRQKLAAERADVIRQIDDILSRANRAPLTGLVSFENPDRPALVIKIDNVDAARPQAGINQADVVFEEIVEGSLTRLAAVFHSRGSDPVGPVRSVRTTDVHLLAQLNKPLFASSGGNPGARAELGDSSLVDVGATEVPDKYFRENTHAPPHNLYTRTTDLWGAGAGRGGRPPSLFTYRAAGAPRPAGAIPTSGVTINYGNAQADYTWNGSGWARKQNGRNHVDDKGVQVAPANVVIQFTDYGISMADESSPEAIVTGSGEAWVFTDGYLVRGRWTRKNDSSVTAYTDDNGNPIGLTPGTTWVALPRQGTATVR